MNCIIIEDQPPAQRILKKYIEDIGTLQLTGTYADPMRAMEHLRSAEVDLIFLDINLPRLSGIDFLKTMVKLPPVILTTAFSDYALESYELDVVDYLLKPFSFQRFVKAVAKVPSQTHGEKKNELGVKPTFNKGEHFIKLGYEHIRISFDDIIYLESDADYCKICLAEKTHLSSEPLKKWLEMLDSNIFTQVHKSYIVNSTRINKVTGNQLHMSNGKIVPLGRSYKEDFAQRFLN